MKLFIGSFIFFSLCSLSSHAQVFENQKENEVLIIENNPPENDPFTISNKPTLPTYVPPNNSNIELPKEELNMEGGEKYIDVSEIYKDRINKKNASLSGEKKLKKYSGDQNLGSFFSTAESISIVYRDHAYPDGDRIKILVNEKVVMHNILLWDHFQSLNINLADGFNKIDFLALNQGSSGPNTAEMRVYDENGDLLMSNQWLLSTGAKATFIVIKE